MDTGGLVLFVESEMAKLGDPQRAEKMASYMKTEMPFYGVSAPQVKGLFREARQQFPVGSPTDYRGAILALWERPHRETKYLSLRYANHYKAHIEPDQMGLYERLITQGAWWDFVDDVAAHLVGRVLMRNRDLITPLMRQWVDRDDMWIRRTAILCQLGHKAETDEALLFDHCLARMHEKEFFIRKAIGWALRDYARTAPEVVRQFLVDHRTELSGLSYREGGKHLVDLPPHKS